MGIFPLFPMERLFAEGAEGAGVHYEASNREFCNPRNLRLAGQILGLKSSELDDWVDREHAIVNHIMDTDPDAIKSYRLPGFPDSVEEVHVVLSESEQACNDMVRGVVEEVRIEAESRPRPRDGML